MIMDLNSDMAEAQQEIKGVKDGLREEIPDLFDFDVVVGNLQYNDTKNSIAATVEPSSETRDQLSEKFGGVKVQADGVFEFEFGFSAEQDVER